MGGEELSDEHNDYDHDQERRDDAAELRAERRPRRLLPVGVLREACVEPESFLGDGDRPGSLDRRGTGIATPSSRRRVDGVEDDAMIQHERAVKI